MSGELTLERSGWPRVAVTVAAVCVVDAALMVFLLPHLHLTGMAQAVVCALTAYLLVRHGRGAAPGRRHGGPQPYQNGPLLAGPGRPGQPPGRVHGEH